MRVARYNLQLAERQKLYLILLFVSLALFFFAMWQVRPVLVNVSDPLGLANHLPPAYWIGLGILFLACALAFLDRELESDLLRILLVLALGIFLVGIVAIVYEVTRNPDTYYPNSEVYRLLANGHYDVNALPYAAYYSWPAVTIVNAATVLTTGLAGDFIQNFVKYMPLFWVLFFVLAAYGAGKRLQLEPRWCFLIAFVALASWWELDAYHNHSWGALLYLLLFMVLISPKMAVNEILVSVLLFGGLLTTHATSSFMFFLGFIPIAIYKRQMRLAVLFTVLFGAWYTYEAWSTARVGLSMFASFFWEIQAVTSPARYATQAVGARLAARYSQLGYLGLYVILIVSCLALFVRGKIKGTHRKLFIACFLWNIGVLLFVVTGVSPEVLRFYLFCLVPAGVIIAVSLAGVGRRLQMASAIAVMLVVVVLRFPAEYSLESSWIQVPPTEVTGSQFFVRNTDFRPVPNPYYFSTNGSGMKMLEDDPGLRASVSSPLDPAWLALWPKTDYTNIDKWVEYVMVSRVGIDQELFAYGKRQYTLWPDSPVGRASYRLYDNGEFQLYYNPMAELTTNTPFVPDKVP